jgi:predicted class III extradiol MEMO1 family dioxygenase
MPRVKEPHLAGRWYPADAAALAARVAALTRTTGTARRAAAVVVPHGAFDHSGAVAGVAWGTVEPPRRVVVIGPSHFASFRGACVLPVTGYRTPLGVVPIDGEAGAALAATPGVRANPAVFMREHAIEAQLPFLQVRAPGATLVPLLLGTGTLLVASSDLVHYGRRHGFVPVPPGDAAAVRTTLRALEDDAIASIVSGDADAFVRWAGETGAALCGRWVLEVMLRALTPGTRGECVGRASSLDVTDGHDTAIGYTSIVFPGTA